jgi:hypothetical protein
MPYKYKMKNGLDFTVAGVGRSVNGVLETDRDLSEAPALELITEAQTQPVQSAQTAQAGAVIGVAPQATVPAPAPEQAAAPAVTAPQNQPTNGVN